MINLDVYHFAKNDHGEVVLHRLDNGKCLLNLPGFSIYEIFMMLNGAEKGLLELSVFLVFIIRYYEEVLPLRKQFKDEELGPIIDDLGMALVLALDAMNRNDQGQIKSAPFSQSALPALKGQHMGHIKYRVKDTLVAPINKKLLTKTERISHFFNQEDKSRSMHFKELYDKSAMLFIEIYEYWNCNVIEQSKSTFFFSSKFRKLVQSSYLGDCI